MGHVMYSVPGGNGGGTDFVSHGARGPGSGRDGVLVGDESESLADLEFLSNPGPDPFVATASQAVLSGTESVAGDQR
jgi:hypothetical protein